MVGLLMMLVLVILIVVIVVVIVVITPERKLFKSHIFTTYCSRSQTCSMCTVLEKGSNRF